MFKTFINIFKVPELRNKVLFTLLMLGIYRIGFWVPLLGVDQQHFVDLQNTQSKGDTAAGRVASYMSLFSGGTLGQSTIFGLGVMPYISASIIFQLLGTVIPSLEKLQKEGEVGRKKIQEWTRYATIPLCVIQAIFFLTYMQSAGLVQRPYMREHAAAFWLTGTLAMTAGSIFLMWLGEQIDEYGLGNGVSLIILAGITARMPGALGLLAKTTNFSTTEDPAKPINLGKIVILVLLFVFIIMGSILITQAQRRIPVQQAKHTRGRRVYGGSKQFLPLRVNHGGVMPIIFAQSLMLFPGVVLGYLDRNVFNGGAVSPGEPPHSQIFVFVARGIQFLNAEFARGQYLYILTELAMIYFFAYFWTTVQFQPKEMANQLRDYGSFIPGLRPGKRTADYLEKVMMRITYVGGAFLCIIAVIPSTINIWLGIDPRITQFLGGTGLLIVVSVALDMVQRIEANLVMRNYSGFLSDGTGRGKRIKGRQYCDFVMPIVLKTRREIELMRHAGQVGHEILEKMKQAAVAGVTTKELDDLAAAELAKAGGIGMSRNYPTYREGEGFPGHTCISVNEEIVHGIPGRRALRPGDLVTLDLALKVDGYCCDMAVTVPIGTITPKNQKLLDVTRQTLDLAIANIAPGRRWSDIARLMQHNVEKNGYSVVREFVGHGVGRNMHEDPKVPNFVSPEQMRSDFKLRPGMTLAVEPMVAMGRREVELLSDGWTVVTDDRTPAAHFEHTIAVTETGVDVLTDGRVPAPTAVV